MTVQKDLKRLVRSRMRKTGESYTTARAQILAKPIERGTTTTLSASPTVALKPKDYAKLARMSDASLKEKTGCTWERWVKALDKLGAAGMSHPEIVKLVTTKYKVGPWWSQMVTVGYERIRGLRAHGQLRDGRYNATKSRTYDVSAAALFQAWADANLRRRWLGADLVKVRTATSPKSMRLDWHAGGIIAVGFAAKGKAKSSVAIEHGKLTSKDDVQRIKAFWTERFDALRTVLADR